MARYALIVENDAGRAARYARLVEDAGAVAAVAGSSEDALAHVRRAGAPAMVLLDRVPPPDSVLDLLCGLRKLLAGGEAPAVVVAGSQAAYERAAGRSEELKIAEVLMRWHPLSEVDRAIRARLVPEGEPLPGGAGSGDPSQSADRAQALALPPHVADEHEGMLELAERLADDPVVERLARVPLPRTVTAAALQRLAAVTAESFGAPMALIWLERDGRALFAAHPRPRAGATLRDGKGSWASLRAMISDASGDAPLHLDDAAAHVFLRNNPLVAGSTVRACAAVSLPGSPGRPRGTIALASAVASSIPRDVLDGLAFWAHRLGTELPGNEPARAPRAVATPASRSHHHPDLAGALSVAAIVSDPDGRVKLANPAAAALFAVEAAKLRSMRREEVLSLLAERTGAAEEIARAARSAGPGGVTLALRVSRRRLRWETRPIGCDGGQGTLDEFVDVTSEAERAAANDDLVRIDAATGLHDRRGAAEVLEREIAGASRASTPLSVVVFEVTLDARDEAAGAAFRSVAWLLRDALRGYDLAARVGPRKLLAILPGARATQAAATAQRLRGKARGAVPGASISFGVSELVGEGDVEHLLSAAEAALAASARRGGAR